MSLCLALLLAAIAIDWWQGWKPFRHPFQMPGNLRLPGLSTLHSQRWRSSPRSPKRESRRAPCSAALTK
jgi:hypothetical protein